MMARFGHGDAPSSSSSVAQDAAGEGVLSVAQGSGGAPTSTITRSKAEESGKTSSTPPVQTCNAKVEQSTTNASPSSLDSEHRDRTSSMCSSRSGKESSSSGGEQLARAVKGASLAFTSSSSSSSLCSSDEGITSSKAGKKLETLKEEESAVNTAGSVEEAAALAAIALAPMAASILQPPTGCTTGEEPKESSVATSAPPQMSILSTAQAMRDGGSPVAAIPMALNTSSPKEARTPVAPPSVSLEVTSEAKKETGSDPGKEIRPQAYAKLSVPRQDAIPSLKMMARAAPPEVVTHGFVSATPSTAGTTPLPPAPKTNTPLRRGKWTVEEEAYVARVIQDFNSGFLNAPAGTTLRSYLSEKLHCDPMRITKKFTGDACIGKRVFHPAVRCASNSAAIDKAQAELEALEQRWRRRLEMQQRESAKKAAASAAAAAAAASGRNTSLHLPSTAGTSVPSANNAAGNGTATKQTVVARTASWLDRATAVLSSTPDDNRNNSTVYPHVRVSPEDHQIEDQMNEVRRLIHEGPVIQQTTAGLPGLLQGGGSAGTVLPGAGESNAGSSFQDLQGIPKPVDKKPRRSSQGSVLATAATTGAEDAEALVGFLNSVRAAASGDQSAV